MSYRRIAMIFLSLIALGAAVPAVAQSSASYTISDQAFNGGGYPQDGTAPASASYRMSLGAVGDAALGSGLSSASFRAGGGFVGTYPPPGEVPGVTFSDHETLVWNGEKSAGTYNLYRDLVSNLSGLGYGACEQQDLESTTATDADLPTSGDGYFYLVTVENRLGEEGSKGTDSDGAGRANPSPCP